MNNQHKSNVHFRVPENYFQEFSDRLHSHIQLEKRLGQTSDGFKVPGGYFKETSENLLRHVHSKPKVFNLNKFVYYAAAVMLIGHNDNRYIPTNKSLNDSVLFIRN